MTKTKRFSGWGGTVKKDFRINWKLYLLLLPVLAYYIVFHYVPMYGVTIAFKDFRPGLGIMGSPWVGFEHFVDFFTSPYFVRILRNTFTISLTSLVVGFPMPIIFALLLNEVKTKALVRGVQTVSYLPYFISTVVVCGLLREFVRVDGLIVTIMGWFGYDPVNLLNLPQTFLPIYVISGVWQAMGFNAVIYFAALSGVDMELYDAAKIDGANRWKQILHVTLPALVPTIVILLILNMGSIMNVGYEKILLLQTNMNMEASDVISTYVYRKGLQEFNFSYSTAVGLFNSVVNIVFLIAANTISRKVSDNSLW
ncbi:MAG: ABC transporter permease [Oscillospiraceae bacterium]